MFLFNSLLLASDWEVSCRIGSLNQLELITGVSLQSAQAMYFPNIAASRVEQSWTSELAPSPRSNTLTNLLAAHSKHALLQVRSFPCCSPCCFNSHRRDGDLPSPFLSRHPQYRHHRRAANPSRRRNKSRQLLHWVSVTKNLESS